MSFCSHAFTPKASANFIHVANPPQSKLHEISLVEWVIWRAEAVILSQFWEAPRSCSLIESRDSTWHQIPAQHIEVMFTYEVFTPVSHKCIPGVGLIPGRRLRRRATQSTRTSEWSFSTSTRRASGVGFQEWGGHGLDTYTGAKGDDGRCVYIFRILYDPLQPFLRVL